MRLGSSSKLANLRAVLVIAVLCAGVAGCGGGGEQESSGDAVREAALAEIEAAKKALDEKRAELKALKRQLADPEAASEEFEEPAEGEEAAPAEDPEVRARTLEAEVLDETDALSARLAEFINEDPPFAGEPLKELQKRSIGMKIDEDIRLAQTWIDEGGDYRKAIGIMEGLVPLDPDNEQLRQALGEARSLRFMTEERFATVEKGQTQEEVRELLGPVNLRNVREYPEKKAVAWFYPKEGGGAAGVYFQEKRGEMVTYQLNFEAIEQQVVGEDG